MYLQQLRKQTSSRSNYDTDTWKYTAKFEKGVSYSVAVKGANDYEVTSVSDGIKYSEDAELDITVGLKPTYAVTVSLPEEPV